MSGIGLTTDIEKIEEAVDSLRPDQEEALHKIFSQAVNALSPAIKALISAVASVLDEEQKALLFTADGEGGE